MKASRPLFGFVLLLAGVLAAARTGNSAPSAAVPAASTMVGDAIAGKATFMQYCSICHGAGAKGFIGPRIAGINWTTPGLHAIVRAGVGGYGSMPAFNADAVTDKNIADIAAYLAALAPSPSPASSSPASASPVTLATPVSATTASSPPPAASGAGDPIHGRQVYSQNCAACHGAGAQGGVGPSLRGEKNRKDTAAAVAWIKNPKLPMPKLYPNPLSEKDVEDVAAYIESL